MIRRLQKTGNSLSLTIPPAVLELLGITPETDLHITTDGKQLFIKPATGDRAARFRQIKEKIFTTHARTFEKLAK